MASKRETLAAELEARLKKINGQGEYVNNVQNRVTRKVHKWTFDAFRNVTNIEPPGIIVDTLGARAAIEDVGEWTFAISFDIRFVLAGDDASDETLNACVADIHRAVFTDAAGAIETSFGVGATVLGISDRLFNPHTGQSEDGIVVTLELSYLDVVGDPQTT